MPERVGIEVSLAASEAVCAADADVIAAYPITPQTHIVEHLSELVADGWMAANADCVVSWRTGSWMRNSCLWNPNTRP